MIIELFIPVEQDETGETEEFSWDLWPLIPAEKTIHLDENGLPTPGTVLTPGMILVGKIGKTWKYLKDREPTSLEKHGLSFETLREKFGDMWKDGSVYVTPETTGVVLSSYLEEEDSMQRAVVRIEHYDG